MTNTPMTSREEFEEWYQSNFATPVDFSRWSVNSNCYGDEIMQGNWETWQASQAQQASVIAELVEVLSEYVLAVAVGGGDDKQSVMKAIRNADNKARFVLAKVKGK